MARCDLIDSCFFFNEQLFDMPYPKEFFIIKHCDGAPNGCAHYQLSDYYPYFR